MADMRVCITGGTGSLGKALIKRARKDNWEWEITVLSRDEVKQGIMASVFPECRYVLGDVRNLEWLKVAFKNQDLVIHAGAMKRVPSAEVNVAETINTNVIGSMNVALAAVEVGVKDVLGISTDKACQPVNAYGESKALMEKLFQEACTWGDTRFHLTRYGNVVGSRGSVVPLFQRQKATGTLTITDARMTRFWLSLDDAIDLILLALAETETGTIVVPKAPAMLVADVARVVAPEAKIIDIGIRPGEKIHEQLVHSGEALHTDSCSWFYRIHPATSGHQGTMAESGYSSDNPAKWLADVQMAAMIAESPEE